MKRTSLVLSLVVPVIFLACGAGENTVGTDWPDAGKEADTSATIDTCPGCTAGGAKLALSAPMVCLSAPAGKPSQSATLDVTNVGNAASGPLTTALSSASAANFIITSNTCSGALPPGGTCQVAVAYVPTPADASATLTVADAQSSVAAQIQGSAGKVAVTPATASFSVAAAGDTSTPIVFRVTTTSFCETQWTVALDNPAFEITSNTCTRAAAKVCEIGVRFAPPASATSSTTGVLSVLAGDYGSVSVALSGVITASQPSDGKLKVSPGTVDFGDVIVGESATAIISVSGAKAAPMAVTAGTGFDQFTIVANTCTAAVEPCTLQMRFAATAAGASSGTLTISDGETTVTVSLAGRGVSPPAKVSFDVAPMTLDFGGVVVGEVSSPLTVTVTARTAGEFQATLSPSAGPVMIITNNTCTAQIPAGGSCTVSVSYAPIDASESTGALIISKGGETVSVALHGTSITSP